MQACLFRTEPNHLSRFQVSKEPLASGRSNVPASATVTVVSAAVIKMGVSVQGNDISAGMSASRYLQLTCTSDTPGTAFSWAITSAEDPRAIGFTVSADGSQVTVPPNSFSSGHSYVVTCSGNSSVGVGATGFASLPVMVLNIPSGGTISASYPQVSPTVMLPRLFEEKEQHGWCEPNLGLTPASVRENQKPLIELKSFCSAPRL